MTGRHRAPAENRLSLPPLVEQAAAWVFPSAAGAIALTIALAIAGRFG